MCKWGQIYILGAGRGSSRVAEYLKKVRLDFVHSSIIDFDKANDALVAFLCADASQSVVQQRAVRYLRSRNIPMVSVGTEDFCRNAAVDSAPPFIQLPTSDEVIGTAFNRALYQPDAALDTVAMRDYAQRLETMTSRERLIAHMAASGETNRRIARVVGLAEKSVERERKRLREKMQVRNSAELMRVVVLGSMFEYCGGVPTTSSVSIG